MENIILKWNQFDARGSSFILKLIKFTKKYAVYQLLMSTISSVLDFAKPFFINRILSMLDSPTSDKPYLDGIILLSAMFTASMLRNIISSLVNLNGRHWGIQLRSILVYEIFRKSLRKSDGFANDESDTTQSKKASQGKIVNLMSSDANQIRNFLVDIHETLIDMPVTIFLSISGLLNLMVFASDFRDHPHWQALGF